MGVVPVGLPQRGIERIRNIMSEGCRALSILCSKKRKMFSIFSEVGQGELKDEDTGTKTVWREARGKRVGGPEGRSLQRGGPTGGQAGSQAPGLHRHRMKSQWGVKNCRGQGTLS